jgi:L-ascorbate metabolism protein UlaG (beta-lactamase superfamily)
MKITKIFHSCLLVEEGRTKILIDPGTWIFGEGIARPEDFADVDLVLISHSHADHVDVDVLKKINRRIITNPALARELREKGIEAEVMSYGDTIEIGKENNTISVRALGCQHGPLPVPIPENVGFVLGEKLFHPGDSLTTVVTGMRAVSVPIVAPWMRSIDGVKFAKDCAPEIAIPVHDGFMKYPFTQTLFQKGLENSGVAIKTANPGENLEI